MFKYNTLKRVLYNQLGKVKYNNRLARENSLFDDLRNALLVVYDENEIIPGEGKRLGVLENADEIILEQEVITEETDGEDILTFKLPINDSKKNLLQNENIVELVDSRYIIRGVTKIRSGNNLMYEVYCEPTWYDIQAEEPMEVYEWVEKYPEEIMADLLDGIPWGIGNVTIRKRRTLRLDEYVSNRLEGLSELPGLFNGELIFNTRNNTIDFVEPAGNDSGAAFVYGKNIDNIEHYYSTENLVTKIYLYGKEGMTIEDAHPDNLPYVENYNFTKKVKVQRMKDERFTNPYHLYERGVHALEVLSKPTASYSMTLFDLSAHTGMSHEKFRLGDNVRVFDKELDIDDKKRIMRWKYHVKNPENTEVEIESKQPKLSDLLSGTSSDLDSNRFSSGDSVSRDEMLSLSPFNYLLNSRADDGFSYWQNSGWEIDPVNGFSGNSSFKAVGENGVNKELKQEVYPSNRDTYAISFRAMTENLRLGPNGKVGVYVTVKYEDGTQDEPIFIPLTGSD